MAITNTTLASPTYNGNGATTAFATGFQFINNADIQVLTTSSTGVETVKTITTDYTVTGAGLSPGGTVTFLVAPATGVKVNIKSNVTIDQQTDYTEGGSFAAATHEDALDKLTKISQQIKEVTDRSLKLPIANQNIETELGGPTANYVLRVNAAADAIEWVSGATVGLTGAVTVSDADLTITDNSDTTKKLMFQASGITTATTRTLTVPDASGTIALTSNLSAYQPLDTDLTAIAGLTSAADKGIQFTGAGTAGVYDLTAAGKALLDDADASAQRTTLGLGTIATQAANSVAITGGSVTGITDLALADGGTGASLSDPNADRILFWDDSAGGVTWLTAGTGLTITGTTIDAAGGGGGISNVVEDVTPQLGGNLDVNGFKVTSPDATDYIDIPNGTVDIRTASTSRVDITDSGVRLGGANARVTTILDEDTMSSNSDTALATQQSIRAYVDANAGGTLVFLSSATASSSATLDFTTGINSTYQHYMLIGDLVPATDSVQLWIRTSANAGVSWDSAGSDYAYRSVSDFSGTPTGTTAAAQIIPTSAGGVAIGNATGEGVSFTSYLFSPSTARIGRLFFTGQVIDATSTTGSLPSGFTGTGTRRTAAAFNGVRFLFSSGNIASGTVRLYGIKNS
jgi:hypothetical protein